MKFSVTSLLVLVFALVSCISASPVLNRNVKEPLTNPDALVGRHLKFPVKSNDGLVAKIMTSVKTDLDAKVFSIVTATFSEQAAASLKIHASILGGLVKVDDVHLKAIESAAAKDIKVGFETSLNAQVQAKIYAPLEISLRKSVGVQLLDQVKLLSILADLEAQAKALINVQLPKIGVSLRVQAKKQVGVAVKGVEVNIPLILEINVDAAANEKVSLDASIAAGLQVSTKLDSKASAKVVLDSL